VIPLVDELIELLRRDGAFDRTSIYGADQATREQLAEGETPPA